MVEECIDQFGNSLEDINQLLQYWGIIIQHYTLNERRFPEKHFNLAKFVPHFLYLLCFWSFFIKTTITRRLFNYHLKEEKVMMNH